MTEEKKAPAKKAAAKKTAAPKAAAAPKAEKKAAPAKSGATVTVVQTRSPAGRLPVQRQTLIGLRLNKIGRTSTLEDTPSVRGMIKAVQHLVKVVDAA